MSQQTPTTDADPEEVLRDAPLPPADDDQDLAPADATRAEPADDGPNEPQGAPKRRGDAARDEITERYRQIQREEAEAAAAPPDDGGDNDVEPEGRSQTGLSASEDDPELELLVYGDVVKAKRSELVKAYQLDGLPDAAIISIAQKHKAADQRLREAKDVSDQRQPKPDAVQSAAEGHDHPENPPGGTEGANADGLQSDGSPPRPDQAMDQEQLADLAQRIQVGDAEEGRQALNEFAKAVLKSVPQATPEQIAGMVQHTLAQNHQQAEIYNSLKKFGDDNPDLLGENDLFDVTLNLAAKEMLADMKEAGFTEAQLAVIGGDRRRIAAEHRNLQMKGLNVRSLDQVLADSATKLRQKFNLTKPSQGARGSQTPAAAPHQQQFRERISRKEAAQPQPRHGNARVQAPKDARPKTALDIINEKRKAGGFSTV
jgi:hypothetical protein